MGHLLKIKCVDSRVNVQCAHFILNKGPIYTHDCASAKFSTNSNETDYIVEMLLQTILMSYLPMTGVTNWLQLSLISMKTFQYPDWIRIQWCLWIRI